MLLLQLAACALCALVPACVLVAPREEDASGLCMLSGSPDSVRVWWVAAEGGSPCAAGGGELLLLSPPLGWWWWWW